MALKQTNKQTENLNRTVKVLNLFLSTERSIRDLTQAVFLSPTSHFVATMNSNVWSTYKVAKSQTKFAMFETPEPWVTICKESLNRESHSLRRLSLESRVWNALTLLKKVGKPQDCTYYNCFDRLLVAFLKCLQHLYLEFKYSELLKPEFKSLERQTHEFKLLEHLNPDSKFLECPHPDFKCV